MQADGPNVTFGKTEPAARLKNWTKQTDSTVRLGLLRSGKYVAFMQFWQLQIV